VAIAYLIKNVIVARFVHRKLAPYRVDLRLGDPSGEGLRAHLEYAACAIVVLVGNALCALSIPFFSDLLGLLGGLLSGPISYLLPIAFFVGTCRREKRVTQGPETVETGGNAEIVDPSSIERSEPLLGCGRCKRLSSMLRESPLTQTDVVICVTIIAFIIMTMFVGTFSVIQRILEKSDENPPFSCAPLRTELQVAGGSP